MSDEVDPTIVVTMAWEILRKDRPMEMVFQPQSIFQLVGLIQLALRHPDLSDELLAVGARFVQAAREYFADCPTVLDVIERGEDPRQDV